MGHVVTRNVLRFFLLLVLQVLIFRRLTLGGVAFNYIQVFLYPLFLFLLPLGVNRIVLLLLGFVLGMSIDIFYDSPGLHASAAVFTAFVRPIVLQGLEPRGGYKINALPTVQEFGINWFYRYTAILLLGHLLFYFSVEAFQLSLILSVLLKTICSFLASMLLIGIYMLIFNPKA
jgi:hypothetical protein